MWILVVVVFVLFPPDKVFMRFFFKQVRYARAEEVQEPNVLLCSFRRESPKLRKVWAEEVLERYREVRLRRAVLAGPVFARIQGLRPLVAVLKCCVDLELEVNTSCGVLNNMSSGFQ